jgi:hypothetical protein
MMKDIRSLLVGLALLAPALPAMAAERLHGVLDDRGRPVPVTLSLAPTAAQGTLAGTLRFDGAWACGFELEVSAASGQATSYFLRGAGAGRCVVLSAGYLHSQADGEGVTIELRDRGNTVPTLYTLTLQPAAR